MKQAPQAAFGFLSYKISSFSFNEPKDSDKKEDFLEVYLDVKGIFNQETNSKSTYELIIYFRATDGEDIEKESIITSTMFCYYEFNRNISKEEIPEYFYNNAIAIAFPYLRAFVSTLTTQSQVGGVRGFVLPLLNLSSFAEVLEKQTTFN